MFHKLHVLGMNDDLWDRVREVDSETWKGVNEVSFWWSWHGSEELE